MAKVAQLRKYLEAMIAHNGIPTALSADASTFLTELARHDHMTVASFLNLLRQGEQRPPGLNESHVARIAAALSAAFSNDDLFRAELGRISADRTVTRETLNAVYEKLSGRTRRLPSKSSKAKLAQDIADFRLERVRSERAADMFRGKPAFAE